MGRINHLHIFLRVRWNGRQRIPYSFHRDLDERRMVEECPQFLHFRSARSRRSLRTSNVFPILPAAGVGTIGRGHKAHRPPDAILFHLPQRIGQKRMPIPVSPINWHAGSVALQLRFQGGDQFPRLLVDRALALEVVVVFGHRQHALPGNIAPAQHGFKKRNHLFARLWPPERNHQNGVVVHAPIIGHEPARLPAENTTAA